MRCLVCRTASEVVVADRAAGSGVRGLWADGVSERASPGVLLSVPRAVLPPCSVSSFQCPHHAT